MKRLLAKWLIGQSVDSGKPLPSWVRRLTEKDESLRHEYQSTQAMVRQLRNDSAAFFPTESTGTILSANPHPRRLKGIAVLAAIVAVLLLATSLRQLGPKEPADSIVRKPIPASASDIKLVEVAITSPLKIADRLASRASSIASKTPTISRPDVATYTTKPIKAVGRKFGHVLAVLAQSNK